MSEYMEGRIHLLARKPDLPPVGASGEQLGSMGVHSRGIPHAPSTLGLHSREAECVRYAVLKIMHDSARAYDSEEDTDEYGSVSEDNSFHVDDDITDDDSDHVLDDYSD